MQTRYLILIGCSKTKKPYTRDPKRGGRVTPVEFYNSQLFRARVAYAEQHAKPWAVLSAAFGLWFPDIEVNPCRGSDDAKPYDYSLTDLPAAERAVWHAHVAYRVLHELWEPYELGEAEKPLEPRELTVEIHAGRAYAHPLAEILRSLGANVLCPVHSLEIGRQLQWYAQQREPAETAG